MSAPIDPVRAADSAAATYHSALAPVVAEIYAGSDYLQVRIDDGFIRVACCGSNDLADWKSNMHTHPHKFGGYGRAHGGFLKAWEYLAPKLRDRIHCYAGLPIMLDGHSRGGSIMQIASITIANEWDEHPEAVEMLTTFGAPHPGDKSLCRSIEKACRTIRRYENRSLPFPPFRDPVPHTPPSPRYHSPGKATLLRAYGLPLHQHSMATYRKSVEKI